VLNKIFLILNLQSLYELETIVDDLALSQISKKQQKRVIKIRHCVGIISSYLTNGFRGKEDQQICHQALVIIRTLSLMAHEDAKTKKVQRRFEDLIEGVGYLESWINHQMHHPGIVERGRSLVNLAVSLFT
jgi:hypothetical protein